MKVNELKALFEKNGVFQSYLPPPPKPINRLPPRSEIQLPKSSIDTLETKPAPPTPAEPTI
jgi:hypothetical protein